MGRPGPVVVALRPARSCALAIVAGSILTLASCTPVMLDGTDRSAYAAAPDPGTSTAARTAVEARLWMPVAGMRVADVTSNFGAPRGSRLHEGIDIFAPRGTPVYSAGDGTVRFVGHTPRGGWTVWIRDGVRDLWYAHLDAVAGELAEGVAVSPQTLIGWVGTSGNALGGPPHLHFEVATRVGPVDPLPLLDDRF